MLNVYLGHSNGPRQKKDDLEHRLVYQVTENKIYFLQARYHYQAD